MVNGQGIIAVYITEESEKQGTAEGPWLAFVIAEILYLKANFLHYFSVNSFFNGFSDFCKACDKGVTLKSAALIFGKNDFISVCDSYDYCRTQDRVLLIAAGRAFHHTFFLAVNHWFSTAATVSALAVPLEELIDFEQEIERLTKEEEKLTKEINRAKGMLSNEKFVSKAPQAKVDEEKAKLEKYTQMMEQVKERLEALKAGR